MGHATATVKLDLAELPANPTSRSIMERAVRRWEEEEADRWSDARYSYPELSPIASERVAYSLSEDGEDARTKSKIIPITTDYAEKTSTLRLEVTAAELTMLRTGTSWSLREAGRFGANVVKVEIVHLPKARAPRAEATEGKSVTLYKVVNGSGFPVRTPKPSYPSQAEARAAAVDFMKANSTCSELAVEAFVQRDTGSAALVTITRPEPEHATATFKVTTETPKPKAKVTGYIVTFDYHH